MKRLTLSLDEHLARQFDQWSRKRGYQNRSEAFRDLLRARIEQETVEADDDGYCIATVSYVYNHHERHLAGRLASAQHEHHGLTLTTQHVHLDHDDCLETVVLRGSIKEVRSFAETLIAERGVRHGKVHLIPVAVEVSRHRGDSHVHLHPLN
ncbi:MAG: nickel-responsive transcriptional regulator NikR [Nevskia sp.]|nr:nickel-responsive transcriptional regulator NikR [Nevskia sp.]